MSLYDLLYRGVIHPWLDRAYRIRDCLYELERELELSRECQEQARLGQFQQLCEHAARTSGYWARVFSEASFSRPRELTFADLAKLPILEKAVVRERLEELSSDRFSPKLRIASQTGGSTAAPTRFYLDLECRRKRMALRHLYWKWLGRDFYARTGKVWGAVQDLGRPGTLRQRLRDQWLDRAIVLPSNQMTVEKMASFLRDMQRFRVRFLHGYGQSIHQLAVTLLDAPQLKPNLEAISYAAEPVSAQQRITIEDAFSAPLYSFYGTREFGTIGAERPHARGLHVHPRSVFLEIVRSDGSRAEPGEPGQILVTDLWNQATPLIRYRIGDIGTWLEEGTEGDLGMPRLQLVGGREQDFLATPDGRLVSGAFISTIGSEGIARVQYIQQDVHRVEVRYVAGSSFSPASLTRLAVQLRDRVSPRLTFDFVEVSEIPPTHSGKTLVVVSSVARQRLSLPDHSMNHHQPISIQSD
jgi:phenylacetate-CoA ligase